ncbi:MAG TPA: LysR family transcriptional regulator [Kofleriaceae bacterium]|nr:LysR family transcriptional regulator [Kofleriaceae bacterium]
MDATLASWDDARFFLALHRGGTLSAAARLLSTHASTVGRRIAAVEGGAGVRLFARGGGRYRLTPAGRALLAGFEAFEREALSLGRQLSARTSAGQGRVRITAPAALAARFLAPRVERLRAALPGIELSLSASDESAGLLGDAPEVAVRLADPRASHLVCRKVAEVPLGLYAAPAYVERHGRPPASMRGHQVLAFEAGEHAVPETRWLERRAAGARVVLRSDSRLVLAAAAEAGAGIALLPCYLADGKALLALASADGPPPPRPVWLAAHRDLARAPAVRALWSALAEVLENDLPGGDRRGAAAARGAAPRR